MSKSSTLEVAPLVPVAEVALREDGPGSWVSLSGVAAKSGREFVPDFQIEAAAGGFVVLRRRPRLRLVCVSYADALATVNRLHAQSLAALPHDVDGVAFGVGDLVVREHDGLLSRVISTSRTTVRLRIGGAMTPVPAAELRIVRRPDGTKVTDRAEAEALLGPVVVPTAVRQATPEVVAPPVAVEEAPVEEAPVEAPGVERVVAEVALEDVPVQPRREVYRAMLVFKVLALRNGATRAEAEEWALEQVGQPRRPRRIYPLADLCKLRGITPAADGSLPPDAWVTLGVGRQWWHRHRNSGALLTWGEADQIATHNGYLPSNVWPEWDRDTSWYAAPLEFADSGNPIGGDLRRGVLAEDDESVLDDVFASHSVRVYPPLAARPEVGENYSLFALDALPTSDAPRAAVLPLPAPAPQAAAAAPRCHQPRLTICA